MRALSLVALTLAAAFAGPALQAAPGPGGGARAAPGPGGGHWAGGPHRPGYGHGGWRYGNGGWRYGHPGWGWGWGVGLGLGYGTGWALAAGSPWGWGPQWGWGSPWVWGAPAAVFGAPLFFSDGTLAPGYSMLDEGSGFVQQPQAEVVAPAAPRRSASFWYYCTEPAGYYPAVQFCARPWIAVQPQTPPPGSDSQPAAPTR